MCFNAGDALSKKAILVVVLILLCVDGRKLSSVACFILQLSNKEFE